MKMTTLNIQWNYDAARSLAAHGFAVFPCYERDGARQEKAPYAGVKWETEATTDAVKIGRLWHNRRRAIPGVNLRMSGHVVIDPDAAKHGKPDGVMNWHVYIERKAKEGLFLPANIPIVETPSGGNHWWFRQPTGRPWLGNREGRLAGLGINVRGSGGYVIGPGACSKRGVYFFDGALADLFNAPEIPDWMAADFLGEKDAHSQAPIQIRLSTDIGPKEIAYAQRAMADEIAKAAMARPGERNNTLNRAAWTCGRYVAHGIVERAAVEGKLIDAAYECGLTEDRGGVAQVRRTINSGIAGGFNNPFDFQSVGWMPTSSGKTDFAKLVASKRAPEPIENMIKRASVELAELTPDMRCDENNEDATYYPEIIRDILMDNATGVMGGQSGVGKTFVMMDMAVAIASGQNFLDREVYKPGGVVFIAAEGGGDFSNRLLAIKRERGIKDRLPLLYTMKTGDKEGGLRNRENLAERIAAIKAADGWLRKNFNVPLRFIIIDTLNAAFPLGESQENNPYLSEVTAVLQEIKQQTGVTTWVIHHFGKNQADGYRGGSALRGNLDQAAALVYIDDDGKLVSDKGIFGDSAKTRYIADKNRYGVSGLAWDYELALAEIGTNPHGKPITSRVVRVTDRSVPKATESKKEPYGKGNRAFEKAFASVMESSSFEYISAVGGEIVRAVLAKEVRKRFWDLYEPSSNDPGPKDEEEKKREERKRNDAIGTAYDNAVKAWKKGGGRQENAFQKGECFFK